MRTNTSANSSPLSFDNTELQPNKLINDTGITHICLNVSNLSELYFELSNKKIIFINLNYLQIQQIDLKKLFFNSTILKVRIKVLTVICRVDQVESVVELVTVWTLSVRAYLPNEQEIRPVDLRRWVEVEVCLECKRFSLLC